MLFCGLIRPGDKELRPNGNIARDMLALYIASNLFDPTPPEDESIASYWCTLCCGHVDAILLSFPLCFFMYALLHTAPLTLSYTEVPDPSPGPDEALVRIAACGICGSDVQGYTGKTGRRIPPLIMGHEAAGTIEAIGHKTSNVAVGQRVCFDSTVYCNQCPACIRGHYNYCTKREVLGVSVPAFKRHGAFAEYVALPSWLMVPMPETLSFVQAALLEPVSIGLHAVNRGGVKRDDTVLIIGAGAIGLFILQAARLAGAARIVVVDLDPFRLDVATQLGADMTLNPKDGDVIASIHDATEGRGCDVSFEAVGLNTTVQQTLQVTRVGGRVTLVGNLTPHVDLPLQTIVSRELTLTGTYASSGEYRAAVALVASGKIQVEPLVSEVQSLANGQAAFDRLHAAIEPLIKIILHP